MGTLLFIMLIVVVVAALVGAGGYLAGAWRRWGHLACGLTQAEPVLILLTESTSRRQSNWRRED